MFPKVSWPGFGESGVFGEEIAGGDGGVGSRTTPRRRLSCRWGRRVAFRRWSAEEGADAGDTAEALLSGDAHKTDDAEEGTQNEGRCGVQQPKRATSRRV